MHTAGSQQDNRTCFLTPPHTWLTQSVAVKALHLIKGYEGRNSVYLKYWFLPPASCRPALDSVFKVMAVKAHAALLYFKISSIAQNYNGRMQEYAF